MKKTFRDWIYQNKYSVSDVALVLGVDRSYLYMIFRGDRKPNERLLEKIQKLTGIAFRANDLLDKR